MEPLQAIMGNLQVDVLKEPRGFIKLLQFLFTIIAFATTTSFSSIMSLKYMCNNNTMTAEIPVEYNFKLSLIKIDECNGAHLFFPQDFSSDSGFFVAIGVIAFLFTIVMLVFYCFLSVLYDANPLYPLWDCILHGIFGVLFLACSSAWANSLTGLKTATSIANINEVNKVFCNSSCTSDNPINYAKLNISIILGFLNCFLFFSNIWFLYKETAIFKDRQDKNEANQQPPVVT